MRKRDKLGAKRRKRSWEILRVFSRHHLARGITPKKLRQIMEELGPTFIKLGQLLSMRLDVLPIDYCNELQNLRTEVTPMPYEEVKRVIEEEYKKPISAVFSSFEKRPLGSASIAQAHLATLADGTPVVVKVQRPKIFEMMEQDIALLRRARVVLKLIDMDEVVNLNIMLDELWAVAQQEMDFCLEADHLEEFYEHNCDVVYITCPKVYRKYTTRCVLVMEHVDGIQIDDVAAICEQSYDLNEIGTKLAENYVKQIIDDGYFHADPHPGNINICDGKIVWLDMGMMGRLSEHDMRLFRNAIRAVVNQDVESVKNIIMTMGVCPAHIDQIRLSSDIEEMLTKYIQMSLINMDLGKILEEVIGLAKAHHISLPRGMTMLGRGILTLEGVLKVVSPDINLMSILSTHLSGDLLGDVDLRKEVGKLLLNLKNSGQKAAILPSQISDALSKFSRGQSKLNVEITGSEKPLSEIDHMVKRIVKGVLSASLLLGSSILCGNAIAPAWLGIPILAWFGFALGIILGIRAMTEKMK